MQPTQHQGLYSVISRSHHFLSSPIRSVELDTYNKTLPKSLYYPPTMLYTFDKRYVADDFYLDAYRMGATRFPRLETQSVKITTGHAWLNVCQDLRRNIIEEECHIIEGTFEDTIELAKRLKSNLFIIHKYHCEFAKIKLLGSFLPIIQTYNLIHPPGIEPGTHR